VQHEWRNLNGWQMTFSTERLALHSRNAIISRKGDYMPRHTAPFGILNSRAGIRLDVDKIAARAERSPNMISIDYFQNSLRSFPRLPIVQPNGPNLENFPLSADIHHMLMSDFGDDVLFDRIVAEGLCMKLLVPISQIKRHPNQRPLNPNHVERIRKSFKNDPLQHMLSHHGLAIPANPELFPFPPMDRASIFVLQDRQCEVKCLDGQHRLEALKALCLQFSVPPECAFWLLYIIHPGALSYHLQS
jgi:hypothetical protein